MVTVRDARPEDAAAIADVHIRTWQAAYRGQVADELLDGLEAQRAARAERWRGWISEPRATPHRVLVAEAGEAVVGFASLGAARDLPPTTGEVYAIYVAPEAWGTGAGRELFARAAELLRSFGFTEAVLWVLRSNARARRFYEIAGWRTDGAERQEVMSGTTLEEVRYRISL